MRPCVQSWKLKTKYRVTGDREEVGGGGGVREVGRREAGGGVLVFASSFILPCDYLRKYTYWV